jgi:WXXGXW repeat (2 copies)
MRTLMLAVALGMSLSPSLAFARLYRGPYDAPPAPRGEVVRTRHGYVWVGGHYGWRHRGYVWTRGYYVRERPGWRWNDGGWEHRERAYAWRPGHWERER